MAGRGRKTLSVDDRILWGKVARTTNAMPGRMAEIEAFAARHGALAAVDQLELRLPDDPHEIAAVVGRSVAAIRRRLPSVVPFFEPSLLDRWPDRLARTADALAAARAGAAGLKIRCGGLDAAAVPSPQAVAAALAACRQAGVPLKATQGLH